MSNITSISNGVKLSRYTVFYDNYPTAGECLAYNTRTQGVLGINKEVREFIDKVTSSSNVIASPQGVAISPGLLRRPLGTPRNDKLGDEEQQCLATLKDSGILIDNEVDENRVLDHWFSEIKYRQRPLHATILTTFKCNFACTYCFEESVKDQQTSRPADQQTMNDQTAEQVIAYLKAKAEEKQSHKIRLMFYGGEPLMNPGAVIKIASALQQWTKERGIKFSFGMITNGSLVRKELMEQLVKLGLTSIRITLDGDKEIHDARRPYLDGRGSFDHIIANITSVIDIVKVELGGNFDRANIAGLHRLLDYLEQKGLNKRLKGVLLAPVVSRLGADNGKSLSVEPVGCHSLSGELAEEGLKLQKELIQRGYNVGSSAQVSACPMTMDDSMLVIDPSGDLYKCEAFVGRAQFCVGNVRTNKFNHRYVDFITMKPWQDCLECPYVPMCGGGCRYIAQLKHSDYTKPACDKEYYEKIFPQLLKMDYERGML